MHVQRPPARADVSGSRLAADLGQLAANVASFDAERAQKSAERDKLRETIATQKNLVATLQERVEGEKLRLAPDGRKDLAALPLEEIDDGLVRSRR